MSFSVDPEFDTPEELSEYADERGIDAERWLFLTGEGVERFLEEGLLVPVARDPEIEDPGLAITHGTRMPVVDAEGRIAGFYELAGGDAGEAGYEERVARRFARVEARLRALAGLEYVDPDRPRSVLPAVNASLNGIAFVLLLFGYAAIRSGRRERHAAFMRSAFVASAAFLVCYVYYHAVVQRAHGPTRFGGTGVAKGFYFALLVSHVLLAIVNLPMVLRVLWLAHRERWAEHRRLARWTFPIWVYVSVTGVVVYVVLYHLNPGA